MKVLAPAVEIVKIWLPEVSFVPAHAPEAEQDVAKDDDQLIVIESFIRSLPARDARVLRKLYNKVVPNVDLTQEYTCTTCSYTADMEVPLTADFFWPDR